MRTINTKEIEYDYIAPVDGFGHKFWVIDNEEDIAAITNIFAQIPAFYVADGHHRTAAAALVGEEKKRNNPNHTGEEEYKRRRYKVRRGHTCHGTQRQRRLRVFENAGLCHIGKATQRWTKNRA